MNNYDNVRHSHQQHVTRKSPRLLSYNLHGWFSRGTLRILYKYKNTVRVSLMLISLSVMIFEDIITITKISV